MVLTEDQLRAENYIYLFAKNAIPSMLLIGKAGTGKSLIISRSVKKLSGYKVCLTAPTNKATDVLRKFAAMQGLSNVKVSTLHSLLRLKPSIVKEGNQYVQKFVDDKGIKDRNHPLNYVDIVVVDEASMLNTELYTKLIEAVAAIGKLGKKVKLLFVGDRYQLPPVHEKESPVFLKETNVVELKTVVRQALDNPLGKILNDMTMGTLSGEDTFSKVSNMNDSMGVYFTSDTNVFLSGMLKKFKSEEYKASTNHVRVLAWSNERVKSYNRYIRKNLIQNYEEPFNPGEIMVVKSTVINYVDGKGVTANISEEFEIVKVFKVSYLGFRCFIMYVNFAERDQDSPRHSEIRVVHPDDKSKYSSYMDGLLQKAKESGEAADWRKFYGSKDIFTDVDYAYALTVHNSQGSTFNTVFVDETDINLNSRAVERMQCKYTAFSRPTNKLIVYSK